MYYDLTQSEIDLILRDKAVRTALSRESFFWFTTVYFRDPLNVGLAQFHKEMIYYAEHNNNDALVVMAFRGSGKSTLMTNIYPIWAVTGVRKSRFILVVSQTQQLVKQHMQNLYIEILGNDQLRKDLGPLDFDDDGRGVYNMTLKKYNARIMGCSMEQAVRGIKFGHLRPDLIILDDIENLASVKTHESREKTWDKITGEILPAGTTDVKLIALGSKLHEESTMMKLKQQIDSGVRKGYAMEVPIVNEDGVISWPERYPTMEDINALKDKIGNERAWQREYCLKIIPPDEQIITYENIQHYTNLPERSMENEYRISAMAIDPANRETESADYTAMVSADLYGCGKDIKIYIHPDPVYVKVDMPKLLTHAKRLSDNLVHGKQSCIFVENNGFQEAIVQELRRQGYPAEGRPSTSSKYDRLWGISHHIKEGRVLFPEKGAENIIRQMVYLGVERHDHLCDAVTLLVENLVEWSIKHKGIVGMGVADMNKMTITRYEDLHKGTDEEKVDFYRRAQEIEDLRSRYWGW